jgi:hypothetical protein
VTLNTIAGDAEVLGNAGALLTVLGFFSVVATVPTVGLWFGVAFLFSGPRATLTNEFLVDVTQFPAALPAPIEPYLGNLTRYSPWRRLSLVAGGPTGLLPRQPWGVERSLRQGRRGSYRV